MGGALVAAALLSLVPFVLEAASGGTLALEGAARTGVVLLPWLALAGLPRRPGSSAARPPGGVPGSPDGGLAALLLLLPALALAAALDLRAGLPAGSLARAGGAGLAMAVLLAAAARASGAAGARPLYAAAWTALLPGSAALLVALRWAPSTGSAGDAPPGLELVAALHPVVWAWERARAGGLDAGPAVPLPLACVFALALCARWRRSDSGSVHGPGGARRNPAVHGGAGPG